MTDETKNGPELSILTSANPEQLTEISAANKPILERARELIATRGWGKGAYSHRWGERIRAGVEVRKSDRGFSIGGAVVLAALEEQRRRELSDEECAVCFNHALDVVVSTLYLSKQASVNTRLHTLHQRMQMASHVIQSGSQLICVNQFNDNVCADKAQALAILDHGLLMVENALKLTRGPLQ